MASPTTKRRAGVDPTIYPTEDHMGEGSLQRFIANLLHALLERWLNRLRGKVAFVGSDQFIYWQQYHPGKVVAPDVFVLPGVAPGIKIDSWKVWETGVVPSFALEVVSGDWLKDYRDAPRAYDELGTPELVIFDPECAGHPERVRWQVFRRLARRGFVRTEATQADRVRSRALGCWLRAVGRDLDELRVRIATGPHGDDLVPTEAETEHARAETERARAETERVAREAAEAEVATLRAELERLRQRQP